MKRFAWLVVLLAIAAVVGALALRLRSSTAAASGLDAGPDLPGSFDSWPEVPRKAA